jgi:hypothetical protein
MCCWQCTALFLEAWILCGLGFYCLPEDDPAGSKYVEVCYNRWKNSLCICWWLIFLWDLRCLGDGETTDGGHGRTVVVESSRGSRGSLLAVVLLLVVMVINYDAPHYMIFSYLCFIRTHKPQSKSQHPGLWLLISILFVSVPGWDRPHIHGVPVGQWRVLPGPAQIKRHRLNQTTAQAHRQAPDLTPLFCSIPQGPKEIGYWETAPGSAIWWALQEENSPLLEKKKNLLNGLKIYVCDSSVVGVLSKVFRGWTG